jgi:hypothetical protein
VHSIKAIKNENTDLRRNLRTICTEARILVEDSICVGFCVEVVL